MNKDLSLLNATGLIDIQFANFGQDVVLEFCHSETGQSIAYLVCHQLIAFHFQDHGFQQQEHATPSGFSHYIHRVQVQQHMHYHIHFLPYVDLTIVCADYEILLIDPPILE